MITICNIRKSLPENDWDFYVDRTSPIGNPYSFTDDLGRDGICDMYEDYFKKQLTDKVTVSNSCFVNYIEKLKQAHQQYGKLCLFCWCVPKRCHAETIKRYLDSELGLA